MEVIADLAPMSGALPGEAVAGGGLATGPWLSANSDSALLYRFTLQALEIRSIAPPASEIPEALATLNTAQLPADPAEDLAISLVSPVTLDGTALFLVYVRDALLQTGRLYAFNPYTLAVDTIAAEVPHNAISFSVSAPVRAGGGSSTEWEFSIACFGLPGGKALLGNLAIGPDGAQLTALKRHAMHSHKSDVISTHVLVMPGSNGRAFVFLCTASGQVSVLEYNAFGARQIRSVGTVTEEPRMGGAACVTAAALGDDSCILTVGYNAPTHRGALAAVATHEIAIKRSKRLDQPMHATFKGLVRIEGSLLDNGAGSAEDTVASLAGATIAQLAIYDMRHEAHPSGAPGPLVIAALASARAGGHKRAEYGLVNTWALEDGAPQLSQMTSQRAAVPGAVLGMHMSGRSRQIEIVTDKNVLVGGVFAGSTKGTDVCSRHGIGMPLDIAAYARDASDFVYTTPVRTALTEQRRRMDGELFIDLLLRMAGISGTKSSSAYPPRTPAAQRALIERVGASDLDDLKRHCLAYYMILDQSAAALVSPQGLYTECSTDLVASNAEAARYARDQLVPRHFEYLTRGYWLMDHGQTAASISYFADPSVIADWAPKILRTAVAAGAYHEAAQLLSSATALVHPRLDEQMAEAPVVMDVLLRCNFIRAFTFQRQMVAMPELRKALLAQMCVFALSTHSRRSVADQLASLPFDGVEEEALEEHCLDADAPAYAKDFLALHYVNRGRYAEAIRLFRAIATAEEGLQLGDVQKRKRDERMAMVRNLTMLLPAAQRWLVQELESSGDASEDCRLSSKCAADGDLGRSRTMDIDNAPIFDLADDDVVDQPGTKVPVALVATQHAAPLSASKSARLLRPVVGTHGALQSASHPLLRVLVKQMSAASASAVASQHLASKSKQRELPTGEQSVVEPTTPKAKDQSSPGEEASWKTPMTSAPDRTLSASVAASGSSVGIASKASKPASSTQIRMPFSGPPSTPRHAQAQGEQQATPSKPDCLSSTGQTPSRSVFAAPVAAETPQIAKRVPGGFPVLAGANHSPFEIAKLKSAAQSSESTTAAAKDSSQAKPKPSRRAGEDTSAQRYNLRHRIGLPAEGPAGEDRDAVQAASDTKVQLRTRKAAGTSELAASSKKSASSYERSARSSDTRQSSRTRKRE